MNENARFRLEVRPPGPVSVSCPQCFLFKVCGGLRNGRPLLNCFDQFCCNDQKCDHVCPYKPDDFRRRMWEIGDLHSTTSHSFVKHRSVCRTTFP